MPPMEVERIVGRRRHGWWEVLLVILDGGSPAVVANRERPRRRGVLVRFPPQDMARAEALYRSMDPDDYAEVGAGTYQGLA